VSYIYDANGHKVAMSDASGTSSFACDPFGELTSATNGAHQMAAYADNADGELTGVTYPLPAPPLGGQTPSPTTTTTPTSSHSLSQNHGLRCLRIDGDRIDLVV
jgi:YD repeat-containing protein